MSTSILKLLSFLDGVETIIKPLTILGELVWAL